MSRVVMALGGNALGNTPEEQKLKTRWIAKVIADMVEDGHHLVICHGNGPQVGMIQLSMDYAAASDAISADVALPECGAMSQGYIGYHLQNGITNELNVRGIDRPVAAVLTRVVVNAKDPAFQNPTKTIGAFYTREEAERLSASGHTTFVEDSGRGYRRVVASPLPVEIQEMPVIRRMMDSGYITIAVGGGGIPITKEHGICRGTAAVIDKDFAAEKLAENIQADILLLLTAVDAVSVNFGKKNQKQLGRVTGSELERYAKEGQFPAGSMLPKVQAALKFVRHNPKGKAIISSLERAREAVEEGCGTIISEDEEMLSGVS